MRRTAVVHLVREANGPDPFDRFIRSYAARSAGRDHDLVLLFKGFTDRAAAEELAARVHAPKGRHLYVSDNGFDLTAYRAACASLEHDRVCFLNSYSRVLHDGWLDHLESGLDRPGVGVAAATGSWESNPSLGFRLLGLPSPYSRAFPDAAALRRAIQRESGTPPVTRFREQLFVAKETIRNSIEFATFPSAHVRTNAFVIARRTFTDVRMTALASKRDALRYENGRRGLSASLRRRGLASVLVDRHGTAFAERDWADANVFCQERQQDLLVADNQTDLYAQAVPELRDLRSRKCWGHRARPDRSVLADRATEGGPV